MKSLLTILIIFSISGLFGQSIKGTLIDTDDNPVEFSNVALYSQADSSLVKVEVSDLDGNFEIKNIEASKYFLIASFVGYDELRQTVDLTQNSTADLGKLKFQSNSIELEGAIVKAKRPMVEVKPDKTVFNVQGTINAVGSDAIELLRKAPGVTVDNNDNINVLGRSGVLLYVDGKRLPLTGDELKGYLESLTAEQIDRMDIITNPGAKYEAEGNAGIIDIRLKKDKNHGANGTISSSIVQGKKTRFNSSFTGNYRGEKSNVFGTLNYGNRNGYWRMNSDSYQNGVMTSEQMRNDFGFRNYNLRLGTDFYLSKNHTIGFLANGIINNRNGDTQDIITIAKMSQPNVIDSVLSANSSASGSRNQYEFNVNYAFNPGNDQSLNVDLDYGRYDNMSERYLPNIYYTDESLTQKTSENIQDFNTPSDIEIYTGKIDYETSLLGGKLGLGSKLSMVKSDNEFLVYDVIGGENALNTLNSNVFVYNENVYAGYISFGRPLNQKFNLQLGLRAEVTDADGTLEAFDTNLNEPPVYLNYVSWFPSAGLTWSINPTNMLSLNYGRRINRPDYNVLNPFNNQLSELTYEKGNPRLSPEIVNNIELGYTLQYRYNFKIAYSVTTDQITRLIGPDSEDPRASFITWENLAEQKILSANISAPIQITPKWNAFFNVSGSRIHNKADYGENGSIDLKAWNYVIFQQHTFDLPWNLKGEVSGYFSGPGVWGGVFRYGTNGALNLGVQRKFLNDQLNVRLSVNDILFTSGWNGESVFNGLKMEGNGNWDSRFGSLNISYKFGNQNVKSRKRKTGLEAEANRVSSGDNRQ